MIVNNKLKSSREALLSNSELFRRLPGETKKNRETSRSVCRQNCTDAGKAVLINITYSTEFFCTK